jgi:putative transposase
VNAHRAQYAVAAQCRALDLSESGFYASRVRPPSARELDDQLLLTEVRRFHAASRGTYGAPRIHADLKAAGHRVGEKRVARLMRSAGLEGVSPRKFTTTTTPSDADKKSPDLVHRAFRATRPNQLWVADITYVPTISGFIFLAIVLDVWSRRIVGWAMSSSLATKVVLDAIDMAIRARQPSDVIHHSDQGCQYTSYAFGQKCINAGIRPSMGTVGDAYDNAMAESFFSVLEHELLARQALKANRETELDVFSYIEGWYNPRRRHSALGYKSPAEFEESASLPPVAPSP